MAIYYVTSEPSAASNTESLQTAPTALPHHDHESHHASMHMSMLSFLGRSFRSVEDSNELEQSRTTSFSRIAHVMASYLNDIPSADTETSDEDHQEHFVEGDEPRLTDSMIMSSEADVAIFGHDSLQVARRRSMEGRQQPGQFARREDRAPSTSE